MKLYWSDELTTRSRFALLLNHFARKLKSHADKHRIKICGVSASSYVIENFTRPANSMQLYAIIMIEYKHNQPTFTYLYLSCLCINVCLSIFIVFGGGKSVKMLSVWVYVCKYNKKGRAFPFIPFRYLRSFRVVVYICKQIY